MDFSSIGAFLAIAQYRNISKAAASLYLSQSNLSARISKLEKEIGYQLFMRQRGKHTVELTPKGQQFMEYAKQISNALVEIENLAIEQDRQFLSVGANAGIHQFTLNAFYQDFITNHPNICLGLHTYHSSDIYNYVNSGRFELGIVSNAKKMPDISTTLIYEEPLFIVANHDSPYYNGIMPEQLPGNHEIFMAYTQDYIAWHEQYWPDRQYFARLSDAFDLPTFFNDPNKWALVSLSTAVYFADRFNWSVFRPGREIPNIRYYLIEKTNKYRSEAAKICKQELFEFLAHDINLISKV